MSDAPTQLNIKDIDVVFDILMQSEYKVNKCNWCNKSNNTREVGPNYICYDCEKQEIEAKRPLIFTYPVRDTYLKKKAEK